MRPEQQSALETQVFSSGSFATMQANGPAADDKDLGFGAVVARSSKQRLLNRDGSFNVRREGYDLFRSHSVYHHLLTMTWPKFLMLIIGVYLTINILFGTLYFMCGPNALNGTGNHSGVMRLFDSIFFSVQTFATIGYGVLSPVGIIPNLLVTTEVLVGLLGFALATGLFFARFSRPTARIIFSDRAIIAPYHGRSALEFRIANERMNQIIHLEARVVMSRLESDGVAMRRKFYDLPLERKQVMFFPLNWTVVHPIDEASPLLNVTPEELQRSDAEFLVLLAGVDDAFSQTVYARSSYKHHEVAWGAKFSNILEQLPDGAVKIDLSRIHETEDAILPSL